MIGFSTSVALQLRNTACLGKKARRRLFHRAVSEKALVTGYHFPFPAVGMIVPDGAGYTFVPAAQLRTTHREAAADRPAASDAPFRSTDCALELMVSSGK